MIKLSCLLWILVILGSGNFRQTEACRTSYYCQHNQNFCELLRMYFGLKSYKWCLNVVCKYCNLCGMCDGEDQTVDATIAQRKMCVEEHNKIRRLHQDTPPLEWNLYLGLEAQKFARNLANKIDLVHGTVGENLFVKMGSNGTTKWSCHSATKAWYSEVRHYDYDTFASTNNRSVEHFKQMVWKKAKRMGVGIAVHKSLKFVYVVARYDQPIMMGEEKENIMPKF